MGEEVGRFILAFFFFFCILCVSLFWARFLLVWLPQSEAPSLVGVTRNTREVEMGEGKGEGLRLQLTGRNYQIATSETAKGVIQTKRCVMCVCTYMCV